MSVFFVQTKIHNLLSRFYTMMVRGSFQSFGPGSRVMYKPISLVGLNRISVGSHTIINSDAQITTWLNGTLVIGNDCMLRNGIHITAANSITIGNALLTGTNVLITDNAHGSTSVEHLQIPPAARPITPGKPVVIGNNVWLGNNVCVMPGVTIGDGVVVGANSVVTHDIPPYSVAVGVPAKVVIR